MRGYGTYNLQHVVMDWILEVRVSEVFLRSPWFLALITYYLLVIFIKKEYQKVTNLGETIEFKLYVTYTNRDAKKIQGRSLS